MVQITVGIQQNIRDVGLLEIGALDEEFIPFVEPGEMIVRQSQESRRWAEGTDRALLWEHQQGRCAYCLREMTKSGDDYQGVRLPLDTATIDHVHPILRRTSPFDHDKRGIQNKVLACLSCNMKKGTSVWEPRIRPPSKRPSQHARLGAGREISSGK